MKFLKKSQLFIITAMSFLMTLFIPTQSYAVTTPPDFSTLTSSIDFSTVITGILAVAGLLALVFVAIRGAKTLIGFIKAG